jgi:hypothetical protein
VAESPRAEWRAENLHPDVGADAAKGAGSGFVRRECGEAVEEPFHAGRGEEDEDPAGRLQTLSQKKFPCQRWRSLLRLYSTVMRQVDGELERAHGLGNTEYGVLVVLANAPERSLRLGELAAGTWRVRVA